VYALALRIRPTSHLTFRILPGSILDIATYPFVPPTTLSGWLRRLWVLKETGEVPGLKEGHNPQFYVLPRRYLPLGAYPTGPFVLHRTHRHGPRVFTHQEFSRLRREGKGPKGSDIQLHTWEYLLAEAFLGVVLAENGADLEPIRALVGYGFKLGKEGFGVLEGAEGPFPVERDRVRGVILGLLRPEEWTGGVRGAYPLYRFAWGEGKDPDPGSLEPSPVEGYEGAYFVWPDGEGEVEGFRLAGFVWPWSLVRFVGGLEDA
jgi:hypothetical protein